MPFNPLSARLGAEPQCDWVDRQLDRVRGYIQSQQHRLLIAGSRHRLPRSGLMAAQVPRGVLWGMAAGRYSTTALRDVVIAVAAVVVDDQIVAPLVRMGRRARRAPAPAEPEQHHQRHRHHHRADGHRASRMYEDGLILMWSTGQAVLAAPLNALVLGATLLGAAVGLVAGTVMAVVVGLTAPRKLLAHLCPSLAILTHLTSNYALIDRANKARARAQSNAWDADLQQRTQKLWTHVNHRLQQHDRAIAALSHHEDGIALAQALEEELVAMRGTRRFLGLGAYPPDNIDRLLEARAAFDAEAQTL